MGQDLDEALRRLTVADVWLAAGLPGEPPRGGVGVCRSPFPGEHAHGDRNPSFSVCHGGTGWRNHATDESGGVWDFAKKALPGLGDGELAGWLIEKAGVVPSGAGPRDRRAVEAEKRKRAGEAERRRVGAWRESLERPVDPAAEAGMAPAVWERWVDGFTLEREEEAVAAGGVTCVDKLAARRGGGRGWPVEWVEALIEMGLLSRPHLPWREERQWAFAVMRYARERGFLQVGYHQVFFAGAKGQEDSQGKARKSWIYVPYVPTPEKARSDFQRGLLKLGRRVPPLPFVVGDIEGAALWVVTEGQWDAAAFAGALGLLDLDFAPPFEVAVFGLRGASSGIDAFLGHYWEHAKGKTVLLVGDADKAGRAWFRQMDDAGRRVPSLGERLYAAGAARVWGRLPRVEGTVDFDDYWGLRRPSREEMWAWASGFVGGEISEVSQINTDEKEGK